MQDFLITNTWALILLLAWSLAWKGVALWKAARNNSKAWFVVLLVVNTVGLLDIIYILATGKKRKAMSSQV